MNDDATLAETASVLRASVLRLARRLRVERDRSALSNNKIAVLSHLAREGASTPSRIARDERQHPQSLTRPLAELEAAGFIHRDPDPEDARRGLLRLTPEGRAAFDADMRLRDRWLADALERLSPEQLALLSAAARLLDELQPSHGD